jgi:hypothetical protein
MRQFKWILLLLLLLLAVVIPLAMQANGTIVGTISDSSGPVAAAEVEVRNVMTGEQVRVLADSTGGYTLAGVREGRYSLRVSAPEHNSVLIPSITVSRAQTVRQDVRLKAEPKHGS